VVPLILVLILIAILFSAAMAVHVLLWVAVIALAFWIVGFAVRPHGRSGGRVRWYRW
jgi:hypothetical protein